MNEEFERLIEAARIHGLRLLDEARHSRSQGEFVAGMMVAMAAIGQSGGATLDQMQSLFRLIWSKTAVAPQSPSETTEGAE